MTIEDDAPGRWRAKKDRRRWCGGHVGREHVWTEWADKYAGRNLWFHVLIEERRCRRCGKKAVRVMARDGSRP